jgi:hypothetical protein
MSKTTKITNVMAAEANTIRLKALGETIRNVLSQHDDQREGLVLMC